MLPTDYVACACIVDDKECKLSNKCKECKKEIEALEKIDKMLADTLAKISGHSSSNAPTQERDK